MFVFVAIPLLLMWLFLGGRTTLFVIVVSALTVYGLAYQAMLAASGMG